MKRVAQVLLSSIVLIPTNLPTHSSPSKDELLLKATDFFCEIAGKANQKLMTFHDISLYEGMALGYVIGFYGENAGALREFGENIESEFGQYIKKKCGLNILIKSHPLFNTKNENN